MPKLILKKHFVSRNKWSHDKKRRQFKEWLKKGFITRIKKEKDGYLYQETESHKVVITYGKKFKSFSLEERGKECLS